MGCGDTCPIFPGKWYIDEVIASATGEAPKPLNPDLLARMDVVVTFGEGTHVEPVPGRASRPGSDEPSERGIKRMRLVRDDIAARVRSLAAELGVDVR